MKLAVRAFTATAIALGLIAVAAPAHAAPPALPEGDALYTITCDEETEPLQLFGLDPATGAAAPIGSGYDGDYCSYDPAWDPTTGIGYGLRYTGGPLQLFTVDLVTGAIAVVAPIIGSDQSLSEGALTIGLDGAAWVHSYGRLYSLDLSSGAATLVGTLDGPGEEGAWGFATDPVTGDLYLVGEFGTLWLVDPDAVTATVAGTIILPEGIAYLYGLTIDTGGTAWIVSYPGTELGSQSALWSTPLATSGVLEYSGEFVNMADDEYFYSFVIFSTWGDEPPAPPVPPVPPKPQLAATGLEATPFVGVAVLFVLAGAALTARGARRRNA